MTENLQENSSVLAEVDLIAESREAPLTAAPRSQMTAESDTPDSGATGRQRAERSGAWLVWTGNIFALLWIGAAGAFLVIRWRFIIEDTIGIVQLPTVCRCRRVRLRKRGCL